ncbi:glycosyltransferase [Rhodoplanes sp. SY1]|uniref:glycosyltransferase family protein n=1 Tax=Rhodoplanes sp. SY1 TaxID=3166646 RepID=UPI0038B55BFB
MSDITLSSPMAPATTAPRDPEHGPQHGPEITARPPRVDAPRIVEIGPTGYMHAAFPQTTTFFSTWPDETRTDPAQGRHVPTFGTLPDLAARLADPDLDLVVVHAPASAPWSLRALGRTLFRRSVLHGALPLARALAPQLVRRRVAAPLAVLDFDDPAVIDRGNAFLLDRAVAYFKRELPADHWQAFTGTLHWRVPTPRFRRVAKNRRRMETLVPLSLGVPLEVFARPLPEVVPEAEKTADIFWAGRVKDSSTVRETGLGELLALRDHGIVVDVPDAPLPLDAYLARMARARLVWTPEGYGWQCFRLYESALCGSVPLANQPSIARHAPLLQGEHALYYDVEPGGLARAVRAALADRAGLARIAAAGRAHVLAHHTPPAIARHVVATALRLAAAR